ncbi:MAG: GbsR/MarR family transcriptional regulator [Candidatus Zhuqueibacterota bacterium]
MTPSLKQEFIQDFGEAYHIFGLPKLMGRIVGLMLYVETPISLDEIASQLNVSKGPVSQIIRRLKDHNLIRRIWMPGDRKDYYQPEAEIFGNAFRNHVGLMRRNLELAQKYQSKLKTKGSDENSIFKQRVEDMYQFYQLMLDYFDKFLKDWQEQRSVE